MLACEKLKLMLPLMGRSLPALHCENRGAPHLPSFYCAKLDRISFIYSLFEEPLNLSGPLGRPRPRRPSAGQALDCWIRSSTLPACPFPRVLRQALRQGVRSSRWHPCSPTTAVFLLPCRHTSFFFCDFCLQPRCILLRPPVLIKYVLHAPAGTRHCTTARRGPLVGGTNSHTPVFMSPGDERQ